MTITNISDEEFLLTSGVFDSKYYDAFHECEEPAKNIAHFLYTNSYTLKSPHPLIQDGYLISRTSPGDNFFIKFLRSKVNDENNKPNKHFKLSLVHEFSRSSLTGLDLLRVLQENAPKGLKNTLILSLYGGGRTYLDYLSRHAFGNYYCEGMILGVPSLTPVVRSGHMWGLRDRFEARGPTHTEKVLESYKKREINIIMIYRHPLDSLITNFVWFFDFSYRRVVTNRFDSIEELRAFLHANLSAFKVFVENGKTPSGVIWVRFKDFLDELIYFRGKIDCQFRYENFFDDKHQELERFYCSLGANKQELSFSKIALPRSHPFRYRALIGGRSDRLAHYLLDIEAYFGGELGSLGY